MLLGHVNIGVIFFLSLEILNDPMLLSKFLMGSPHNLLSLWLSITQSRSLKGNWLISENNEKVTLPIDMP